MAEQGGGKQKEKTFSRKAFTVELLSEALAFESTRPHSKASYGGAWASCCHIYIDLRGRSLSVLMAFLSLWDTQPRSLKYS